MIPPTAQAKLLASASDSGTAPFADAGASIDYPKGTLRLVIGSSQPIAVDINVDLQCERGTRKRSVSYKLLMQSAPLERFIALPMKRAEWCYADIDAGYHEGPDNDWTAPAGEIVIQIFGNGHRRVG